VFMQYDIFYSSFSGIMLEINFILVQKWLC
jgi:hypothetical protein